MGDCGRESWMRYVDDAGPRILAAAKDMVRRGLVEGTAGNISARQQDGTLVITPAAIDYAEMDLDDLVVVDPQGETLAAKDGRSPSSELMLHLACYRAFEDVGSVIHSHPVHSTMFAIAHQGIPAFIDEFAMYVGGDVRCTEYAPSGSAAVGERAVEGPPRPRRGADRQPRPRGGWARPGRRPPHHRSRGAQRPDHVGGASPGAPAPAA